MNKETEQKNTQKKSTPKVLQGVVSSVKMKDTIVVDVNRYHKHSKYKKYINTRKKYKAHDPEGKANLGDQVSIIESKPISKDKNFKLLEIIKVSNIVDLSSDLADDDDKNKDSKSDNLNNE